VKAVSHDLTREESLRDIVARVVEDGKDYARAEVALVKTTVTSKVDAVKPAVIFYAVALVLALAALPVLVAALGMALAIWLGVAGGLAVGAVIVLAMAGLFVLLANSRLKQAF